MRGWEEGEEKARALPWTQQGAEPPAPSCIGVWGDAVARRRARGPAGSRGGALAFLLCRLLDHGMSPVPKDATPAMAQWFALKAEHPDALLFFRMGDFYEMFFEDAHAAVAALDIALTHRGEHGGKPIPMCGVPVHASEAYLARLIRRGFRVAVGEQMEDPKLRVGKAPIKRAVVRLITPGTLTEDALLESARANLLLAVCEVGREIGAAWLDVSTGLFETQAVGAAGVPALLGRLDPAEILVAGGVDLGEWRAKHGPEYRTAREGLPFQG